MWGYSPFESDGGLRAAFALAEPGRDLGHVRRARTALAGLSAHRDAFRRNPIEHPVVAAGRGAATTLQLLRCGAGGDDPAWVPATVLAWVVRLDPAAPTRSDARLAVGALGALEEAWDEVTWAFADLDLAPDVERGRFPGRVMVQNRALMLAIAGSGPRAALQPARAA